MDQRVSFITLGVEDLERAHAFYSALGWKASTYAEGKGVAFFELVGGLVLALYPRGELARDAGLTDAGRAEYSGFSLSYNVRSREECDALVSQAERAGGKVLRAPYTVFWGGYVGYFADTEGHLWEVAYNPEAHLDADGRVTLPG